MSSKTQDRRLNGEGLSVADAGIVLPILLLLRTFGQRDPYCTDCTVATDDVGNPAAVPAFINWS